MRITSIETKLYRVPPTIQISDAIQSISHWEWIVTTIRTDAGITGTGWSYTVGMGGTAVRALIDDYLSVLLLGQDARDIERLWERSWLEMHAIGAAGVTTIALAPIDIASSLVVSNERTGTLCRVSRLAIASISAISSSVTAA